MGCEGGMDIDLPTQVDPTEETVDALLEYLVGPLLPLKHSDIAKETLSESQQKSVAKQVHAAAVLYNYYHRVYNHRESEFLKFDNFCNLAIMFKPSILHHMKYMCQSDRPVLKDPESQLSLTEKAIMDACTISETLLAASTNLLSIIKEWPITKVAVLLIDSNKENCFLKFNNGLWSIIENNLYSEETETASESQKVKKRRMSFMGKNDAEREAKFLQLAFSAVKEVAGIMGGELKVLESHVVYSLSQAKTATRFYIVQSTRSLCEDNLVPIQDVIFSLQGPVVKKCSGGWVITPVVEHYYLLPYAEIISKLFSSVSDSLLPQAEEQRADSNISLGTQKPCEKEIGQSKSKLDLGSVHISDSSKEEPRSTNNICKSNTLSNDVITSRFIGGPFDHEVKETENLIAHRIKDACSDSLKKDMNGSCRAESNNSSSGANIKAVEKPLKVYSHVKRTTPTNSVSTKGNSKELEKLPTVGQSKDEKVVGENKSCMVSPNEDRKLTADHALISCQKNGSFEDFKFTVDAKRSELSEAALRALLNKRQKLYNQQRVIEGELTLCDKKIQAIMHGGVGDCLGLKLEAVIDCCNEICLQDDMKTQAHTNLHVGKSLPLSGKSLSEAQITLKKACQELDDICLSNNWMLPTYQTSHVDGGFVANVVVKGANFECSGVSGIQPSVHEARNSAATHVITRLQQMAGDVNTVLH